MKYEELFTNFVAQPFISQEVNCLRLLRSFSPSHFEPKLHGQGSDDMDMEQSMNLSMRGQITDQLVELPILRQVYDMIDAAGSKGLTNIEVSAITEANV